MKEAVLVSRNLLDAFVENTKHIMLNNIIVLKDGEKIAEHHWVSEIRQNQYSVSKSFTSAAIGIAIGEGLLTLDDPVIEFFPDKVPHNPSERLQRLKVRHLLTMSVGHRESYLMAHQRYDLNETDWIKYSLNLPLDYEPGTHFVYSNVGPYLAGMIIKKLTKCDLLEYLMPRLFEPLGIWRPTWETDAQGNSFGSSGLMLRVSEIAKFGQLYLQKGQWKGKQLIPEEWVNETSKTQIKTGEESLYNSEYSYLFWMGPNNSYRADGMFGQYSIIMPDKNAVVAINAYNTSNENILDYVWKYIYPFI